MIRWLIPARLPEVARYVELYWYLEKPKSTKTFSRPKLNPDPSAHLILSSPNEAYHYKVDEQVYTGRGSHWIYPHGRTFELEHTDSFSCLGIKFKVGALYSINNVKFDNESLDTVDDADCRGFLGFASNCEVDLLAMAKNDPDLCGDKLDELLLPSLSDGFEDKHSEITRRALPLLATESINDMGKMLFCSQRTIERSFLKVTGLTLKQCQSINRLESILEYLYQRKPGDIDWVDIACQFGFSDQPHLIRHLKQHLNLTPQRYAEQRGFTIDIYGGVLQK